MWIGSASLTLLGPDDGPISTPATFVLMEAGRYGHPLSSTDGRVFESGPLWPGTYLLRATYGTAAPDRPVPIEIRPGETTAREIRLAAGRSVVFSFRATEEERLPRRVALEVRDGAGVLAFQQDPFETQSVGAHEVLMALSALPFGAFTYSARSEEGWSATGKLEVVPGREPQQDVTIQLIRER